MAIAIVSERISPICKKALADEGFFVLSAPADPSLPEPISHHPDTLFCALGDDFFCPRSYFEANTDFFSALRRFSARTRIHTLTDGYGGCYPRDCAYNLLAAGKILFYNPDGLSPLLARAAEERGFHAVSSRQGYAACSVCMLGEKHAITADLGMVKTMEREGIAVLKIEGGEISLPPYSYGFIGGASGCFGKTVYFFGDISKHPSYADMKRFAQEAGFTLRALSGEPLLDLGGILFLE